MYYLGSIASSMFLSSTLNVAGSTVVVNLELSNLHLSLTSPATSKVVGGIN